MKIILSTISFVFLALSFSAVSTPVYAQEAGGLVTDCDEAPGVELTAENCGIINYLVIAINLLSGVAGLAVVASVMIAGFQYMTAQDNSGQIEAARKRIIWAITALLMLIFTYAFLNFIVPGGVL